jgi:hypothetical protein
MDESRYAVLAEKRSYDKRLYLHDLTFDQLVDEVVVPCGDGKPFFIDGVPVEQKTLEKIKIVKQAPTFAPQFTRLHQHLDFPKDAPHRVTIQDYPGRLDALFRAAGSDITTSLVAAYREKKPLNLPKDELVKGLFSLVAVGIRSLGG